MTEYINQENLDFLHRAVRVVPVGLSFALFVAFGWAQWKYVVRPMLDWARDRERNRDED
jgi:hypothetical protein